MRLSESLRKNILEAGVGRVTNKFKLHKRRNTLFFEELLSRYILECEKEGFIAETRSISQKWMFLYMRTLMPNAFKKIPSVLFLNTIMRRIWHNLGLIDDFHIKKNGDVLRVITKKEGMTRSFGKNNFMPGLYMGVIEALFDSSVMPLEINQKRDSCSYNFRLYGKPLTVKGKPKEHYKKLNSAKPVEGYTLKDALKNNMFTMNKNRMCFRGKFLSPVENTLFHIISEFNVLPEKMTEVSHEFFKEIIDENTNDNEKLSIFKTLFQIMGWGVITVIVKGQGRIVIEIKNPPHGLVLKDNWDYLFRTFLGYLWLIDKGFRISKTSHKGKHISVEYSR